MIDVIKYTPTQGSDWLVYRYPGNDYNYRSKLIVGPGQRAVCVHMGQIEGEFKSGITILDTENYDFMKKYIQKGNQGSNPYPFEIYFINTTLNMKTIWGTNRPCLVNDPQTTLLVHLRAHGSYIFRLRDAQFLLNMVIGDLADENIITFSYIHSRFEDKVQEAVQYYLSRLVIQQKIPVLELAAQTKMLSQSVLDEVDDFFRKYGFEITDFQTASISVPEEDMEAMKKRREYDVLGTSHVAERQLDISESWSKNEGTAGGVAVGMMGLGIGFQNMNPNGMSTTPSMSSAMNQNTTNNQATVKLLCPNCRQAVDQNVKFCPECGFRFVHQCPKCGSTISLGTKFCPECGEKL